MLLILLVAVIFTLGEYHVVSGTPGLLVKRTSLGFADAFASVEDCVGPRLFVFIAHPSLCAALERDGVIGSNSRD